MLRITTDQKRGWIKLSVEGRLAGPWVGTLEECWRDLRSASPHSKLQIHLCEVSYIDRAGRLLLAEIHRQGGLLIAEGCLNQAIVEEIVEAADAEKHTRRRESRRKSGPMIFWLLVASVLGFGGILRAQEKPAAMNPAAPLKLTLDQAVALALKQNPQVQIAVLTAAQSDQDRLIARAGLLPQAELQVSDAARRTNIETGFGRRIPGIQQHTGPFQIFSAGPSFGTPIFDLTLWRRWQAARETVSASRALSLSTREQVVLLVVSQYLGCLRASADVKAAESRVALAQALYDQAADLQKEGVGTGIDTLRANVELQNEKQRLIQSLASQQTSLYGLSRLLNLDPKQKVEVVDELSFFETPSYNVEESLDKAFAARPELKALDAQIRSAERSKQAASASRLPSLRFDGNWAYSGVSTTAGIPVYTYEVSANMALFTGGRIRAEIVRADLEIQKIEQQRADQRNQVGLDVKTALVNLESARNEVQVANLGVKLAGEEVTQARDRFQAGVANNIEVISAQDSLARANDNQIAALYRFNQSRADLARSLGEIEKLYAK